jgi:hypothetical protein
MALAAACKFNIVQRRDVNLYNHICIEVEKQWKKLNIPLHALANVLTPKYYHISWLAAPAPEGGVKRKPHQDPKVQASYMQALNKCSLIRSVIPYKDNSPTTSVAMVPLGPTTQLEIEGIYLLSSSGTCMAVLPHSYNVWQHRW